MGPGIFVKAVLQGSFSLMVFGWTQILMDLQPLFSMLNGMGHLHGFSHTYVGGSLIAVAAALSGKYLSELGLKILGINEEDRPIVIVWWVCFLSAFIGSFSHVFLDSIMHADVTAFYPFTNAKPLFRVISVNALHKFCMYSGLAGAGLYYLVYWRVNKK